MSLPTLFMGAETPFLAPSSYGQTGWVAIEGESKRNRGLTDRASWLFRFPLVYSSLARLAVPTGEEREGMSRVDCKRGQECLSKKLEGMRTSKGALLLYSSRVRPKGGHWQRSGERERRKKGRSVFLGRGNWTTGRVFGSSTKKTLFFFAPFSLFSFPPSLSFLPPFSLFLSSFRTGGPPADSVRDDQDYTFTVVCTLLNPTLYLTGQPSSNRDPPGPTEERHRCNHQPKTWAA